ncbi:cytochrome P450 monooxygenase-like protein [Calycina marina]|uniref:Cytochrome P450 monooxygenase-like protein n=1 Tax=Calycina marina TaxID=1763456 RepID=A0A9P8CCS2_9HELO|nr:cytochrome P450 monooxygenase-like protein [Calycina marina]
MITLIIPAIILLPSYILYINISALLKNIAAAKRSGLPYIVSPINLYNPFWQVLQKSLFPLIARLPESWTKSWIDYMGPDWPWDLLHVPWEQHGEVFLTVSPGRIHAWVTNAEAINQITKRREAFPKPIEAYGFLDIFGRNVVTTEGIEWKEHRKITSPSFNEKNNAMVFKEACSQAQAMLRKWSSEEGNTSTIQDAGKDIMKLTLHVISSVGFGKSLFWPGEKPAEARSSDETLCCNDATDGHSMSFEHTLTTLLDRLFFVLLTPKWLLKRLPIQGAREAHEAFDNWSQYMKELLAQKIEQAQSGKKIEGMDIMGTLVRTSYGPQPISGSKADKNRYVLSDTDIFGNAFVMIIAGHETTANCIHFSLVELAIAPKSQRLAQGEIRSIFETEAPASWDYESCIGQLLGGMLGAIMYEILRLVPASVIIPKTVLSDQDVMIDGNKITMPAGTQINLVTVGTHRSIRYWPTEHSKISDRPDNLNDFMPERWLVKSGGSTTDSNASSVTDDLPRTTARNTHADIFRPVPGSYIPFSEGARSCLGRRLAQVEIMGVLAVILRQYSVELAVDEWASDAEVEKMTKGEKRVLYAKAQEKARKTMRTATSMITLKLQTGSIPMRIVKKGEERFINDIF